MPTKYFADQFDDEDVKYVFRHHPIVMRKGLIISMLALLVGPVYMLIMTYVAPDNVTLNQFWLSLVASFALGIILMAPSYISWYFSVFIVTNQRFIQIKQKGLFNRSVADLGLSQIQSVNYEVLGLQETLLGFGTIKMQTYVGDLTIHDVHHPGKIQKKISTILRDENVNPGNHPSYSANSSNNSNEET